MSFVKLSFLLFSVWAFCVSHIFAGDPLFVSFDRLEIAAVSENGTFAQPAQGRVTENLAIMDRGGVGFHHGHTFVIGDQVLFVDGEPNVKIASELVTRQFIRIGRLSPQAYFVGEDPGYLKWQVSFADWVQSAHSKIILRKPPLNREVIYRLITLSVSFDEEAQRTKSEILNEIDQFQRFATEIPKTYFQDKAKYLSVVGEDTMLPFDDIQFLQTEYVRSRITFLSGMYTAYDLVGSQFEATIRFAKGKRKGRTTGATLRFLPGGMLKLSFKFPRRFGRYDTYVSKPFDPNASQIQFDMKAHGLTIFRLREKGVSLCWRSLRDLFPD